MKGKLPLFLIALALVAAVVWLARSGDENPAPTAAPAPASLPDRTTATPPKSARPATPTVRNPTNGSGASVPPESIGRMIAGQRMRIDGEIATLVRTFGLSDGQEKLLREWYEGRLAVMEERLRSADGLTAADLQDLAASMRSIGLDQVLDGILTDEQRADLERTAEQNRHAQVERHVAGKLKDMKESLDLTPPQLQSLRQVLYNESSLRYQQTSSQRPFQSFATKGRAIDLEDPGIILGYDPDDGAAASFEDLSGEERLALLREARSDYIAEVIAKYSSILTPEQAESYRATLERQSSRVIADAMEVRSLRPDPTPSELPLIRGIRRK